MATLTATYRLQMNAGFTLAQAREQVAYFASLGVSHLYLSPILAARSGSMHGYDVVDPTRINPELGSEGDLRALAADLRARGMGLVVDIVPNHMGIGAENPYWEDILTHGERSRFASWFDVAWATPRGEHRKLVLPVLGDEIDQVLERGELTVEVKEKQTPRLHYFDQSFPLDPATLPPDLQLATFDPPEAGDLTKRYSGPKGAGRLHALLDAQHYKLVFWRRGPAEINYRRFFDVNDLAAVRMEDEAVFAATHAFILELVRDGVIDALRVDHIDGLLDPLVYLQRLRAAVPEGTPIFVEKILSPGETLRESWPVQGTTGYESLNDLEEVFLEPKGFAKIESTYRAFGGKQGMTFEELAREGKTNVLRGALRADTERLGELLRPLAHAAGHRWSVEDLNGALVAFMAGLPVYRTYIDGRSPIDPADRAVIDTAVERANEHEPERADIVSFIRDVLMGTLAGTDEAARVLFVSRLQQVSGPATAKGVEDTALYVYVPLASRNEVGGAPDRPLTDAVSRLHEGNSARAKRWPLALTATNTHDTKRSADVRARLEALSEVPEQWARAVQDWRTLNEAHRESIDGQAAPDVNTEYLLYQMLVGLWPAATGGEKTLPDAMSLDAMRDRLNEYMLKAAKEAKTRTSWVEVDERYEAALKSFIGNILNAGGDTRFLADVAKLVSRIATAGAWNSLSRIAIHLTSPGTPDTYQGDEFWNFTLVDPDNRMEVDYRARSAALTALETGDPPTDLAIDQTKLALTRGLLTLRRERADLFRHGEYRPLKATGGRARHVVAFLRTDGRQHVITIAGRLLGTLQAAASPADWWADTVVDLPAELRTRTWSATPSKSSFSGVNLRLADLLRTIPVAVLAD